MNIPIKCKFLVLMTCVLIIAGCNKWDRSVDTAGIDADGNGVRDDIDRYIEKHTETDVDQAILKHIARSYQKIQTTENITPEIADSIFGQTSRGLYCLVALSSNYKEMRGLVKDIEKYTPNTAERKEKADEFQRNFYTGSAVNPNCEDIIANN